MKKRRRSQPSTKELIALLREQDRVIVGLIELVEERGALIEMLTRAVETRTATSYSGINGTQH